MDTEIELKYLVMSDNVVNTITEVLTAHNIPFSFTTKNLANHYFDTPELNFRQHDMGLRVREVQGKFEQTIKTAGKVIGGLHQRPEFNYPINQNLPDLTMFPEEIWSESQSIELIQSQLLAIFTTNFTRHIWLISNDNGSVIELVYDEGEISSNGQRVDIKEIELELLKGNTQDLFSLATCLFSVLSVRPGIKSKAARGYALWQNDSSSNETKSNVLFSLSNKQNIDAIFYQGINFHLALLQNTVDAYMAEPSLELLGDITDALALLRHGFWLFSEQTSDKKAEECQAIRDELSYFIQLLSWVDSARHLQELTNKTGNYRKKLELSQALITQIKMEKRRLPSEDDVKALLHSLRFNQLQLALLKLILSMSVSKDKQPSKVINFAQKHLSERLESLVDEVKIDNTLNVEAYLHARTSLHRCLLTGNWLGSLFDEEERQKFRSAWLDLQQGLSELQALWFVKKQLQKLEEPSEKLNKWQDSKVENLLATLEHTRLNAVSISPYWVMTD